MVNDKHLELIKKGVTVWNEWKSKNYEIIDLIKADLIGADLIGADLIGADLSGANLSMANLSEADLSMAILSGADLSGANLNGANLSGAYLIGANLIKADLSGANLNGANLSEADLNGANLIKTDLSGANLIEANLSKAKLSMAILIGADLIGADLNGADLSGANLNGANLNGADFSGANLSEAFLIGADLSEGNMVRTNFNKANLTECKIYGVSAWDLNLEGTIQKDLIITKTGDSTITVDNLEVAQFIYLILNNQKLHGIIDTITSKTVLILGRFTPERKAILDALKEELRNLKYLPILFDFEKPGNRSLTDTVTLLARMSRFIIADISDPKSVPHELYAIVPTLKSVPVQLILDRESRGYPMVVDILEYHQVIEEICLYDNLGELLGILKEKVINPAESRAKELEERRNKIEEKYKEFEKGLKNKS